MKFINILSSCLIILGLMNSHIQLAFWGPHLGDIPNASIEHDFHRVCRCGLLEDAQVYVSQGINIDLRDEHRDTPLIIATRFNEEAIIDLLLKHNASLNVENNEGETPLVIAVVNGNVAIVKKLLDAGADINYVYTCNPSGREDIHRTALHDAVGSLIQNGSKGDEVLALLLARGACPNKGDYSPLIHTIQCCDHHCGYEATKLLIAHGADVNYPSGIAGKTLIEEAITWEDADKIQLLLDAQNKPTKAWSSSFLFLLFIVVISLIIWKKSCAIDRVT